MKLVKFFAMLLMAASMAFLFTACSSDDDKDGDDGDAQVTTTFSDLVDTGSALTFSYTQTVGGMSVVTTETYGYSGTAITSHTTVTEYPSANIATEAKNELEKDAEVMQDIDNISVSGKNMTITYKASTYADMTKEMITTIYQIMKENAKNDKK